MAPVVVSTKTAAAVNQCTVRSVASKRATRPSRAALRRDLRFWRLGDVCIVASVGVPDPGFDVVTLLFPKARDGFFYQSNRLEPFRRLVAVHRRHIEPHGAAVLSRNRGAQHLVGNQDVAPVRLGQREAFGVKPIVGRELDSLGVGRGTGAIDYVAEQYPSPRHIGDPPASDTLKVP